MSVPPALSQEIQLVAMVAPAPQSSPVRPLDMQRPSWAILLPETDLQQGCRRWVPGPGSFGRVSLRERLRLEERAPSEVRGAGRMQGGMATGAGGTELPEASLCSDP